MRRLSALLLRLYPPSFRRAHGREVEQFMRAAERDGSRVHLVADLIAAMPREWFHALRPPRFHQPSPSTARRSTGANMVSFARDLRYSARLLMRSPGFTAAAVITLALGIGANTAIFSLANATLLRPLDVSNPDRLAALTWSSSYRDHLTYAGMRDVFSGVAGVGGAPRLSVSVDGASDLRSTAFVSGNMFAVLGVTMAAGRPLQPSDDVANSPVVGVLAYDAWQSMFGGRTDAIGRVLHINGRPVTIVGVARQGFRGTSMFSNPFIYVPITATPHLRTGFFEREKVLENDRFVWITVIARLVDGVHFDQASRAVDAHYRQLHPLPPGETSSPLHLEPLTRTALGSDADAVRSFVLMLGAVVGLTLLIGCANLANLLLARTSSRRREVGVRLALGAGRGRVMQQMLAESVLLAAAGGAAGIAVAWGAMQLLGSYELPGGILIGRLGLEINRAALITTAGLAILTALIFGAAPAWRASRTDVMVTLRDETRGATAHSGLRSTLVAAQVAFSLVLLIGSALFLRSLVHGLNTPLGFTPDGVALASVNLGLARYDTARAAAYYDDALARVKGLPQVKVASWSNVIPTAGDMTVSMQVEGYQPAARERTQFNVSHAGAGYFTAAGTRVVSGRQFESTDSAGSQAVAIVNETAARKYWNGLALGQRIRTSDKGPWATIVGIVEDTTVETLNETSPPYAYFPFTQRTSDFASMLDSAHLFVRTDGDPNAVLPLVAEQLRSIDAKVPLYNVRTFETAVRGLVMPQRMGAMLLAFFSALALVLATVGIYGVAAYVAALRTREIGIRMALGAGRREIGALMLRQGAKPVAFGMAAGLLLSLWAGRLASSFLLGVSPRDPLTFAAVAALLGGVALLATYIPARRAARIDPVSALRHD